MRRSFRWLVPKVYRLSLLAHSICDVLKASVDAVIVLALVREGAVLAGFNAAFEVGVVAAAVFAQHVEWAVTKEAVKVLGMRTGVAWEVFACCILKEFIVRIHGFSLEHRAGRVNRWDGRACKLVHHKIRMCISKGTEL